MMVRTLAMAALAFAVASAAARAADPRYPDWPCTQAKVPEISLAAVWAGPALDDAASKWKDDAKVSALVSKLVGAQDAAGRGREVGEGIFERLRGRQDRQRKTAVRRPVRHAQRPALARS